MSEEALNAKINSKIDSIVQSHRAEKLASRVEKLDMEVKQLTETLGKKKKHDYGEKEHDKTKYDMDFNMKEDDIDGFHPCDEIKPRRVGSMHSDEELKLRRLAEESKIAEKMMKRSSRTPVIDLTQDDDHRTRHQNSRRRQMVPPY
jgi:hypothetical protein